MPFEPGSLAGGRFEVLRRLGAGGLAEVYAARDTVTGQTVALKALHQHLLFDTALVERFRRELAVTRQLDHPGIVRVYDLYDDDAVRPFFAMELLEGETLADRLRRGALPPKEARRIALEICAALKAAHRAGVVHRDLKPQNIWLTQDGRVKLLDFGLARAAGMSRLTAQSTVMGTPGYVAPELLGGAGVDARSDVYSLGATLFEMLTGQRAFPFADPYRVLRRQKEPAPSARAVHAGVSAADDEIVKRALDPDPEQRYADVAQLERALRGARVPEAPRVPAAMTSGDFEVVVHSNRDWDRKEQKVKLQTLIWALGGDEDRHSNWITRVGQTQAAPLVSGCSKQTGTAIAAFCQERGVPATVQPRRERGLRWWLKGGIGATVVGLLSPLLSTVDKLSGTKSLVLGALLLGLFIWLGLVARAKAPFRELPEGDPNVRRLLEGISRRAARLRDDLQRQPKAVQALLADLERAVGDLVSEAHGLGERAARLPPDDDDAPTLVPGRTPLFMERDALIARLLEIAATLDETLATVAEAREPAHVSGALKRLREELEFVRSALPQAPDSAMFQPPPAREKSG